MDFKDMRADMEHHPIKISETDECVWCRKKALITDNSYVYCSEKCRELFINDCQKAVEDASRDMSKVAMKTIIIGVSGKKQSGKNTLCDGLFERLEKEFGEGCVKTYSYADALKEKVCIEVLGLTKEQCYGTDEQKNSLTQYKWENLPHEVRYYNNLGYEYALNGKVCNHVLPEGYMTAREIMQVVGTDVFRKMFSDTIWVDATFRNIDKEGYRFALISDVRFSSEVVKIGDSGGCVFRLLRDVCECDAHESESALDNFQWDLMKNAFVINNKNMTVDKVTELAINLLMSSQFIKFC